MKCLECKGVGFKEFEHGLIMVGCELCGGTGEVETETLIEVAAEANAFANALMPRLEGEILDDSDSGTGRDNQPVRSTDTSKPKRIHKPKAKRGAGKKSN